MTQSKKIIFILLFVSHVAWASNRVKSLKVAIDELALIHTAVGIATIIQLPEAVESVIIGDQGAFKVEYLDKAITIKPLRFGARTNLYVTTHTRRYNVRLETRSQDSSDYVVYLAPKVLNEDGTIKWREFARSVSANGLTVETKRIGKTKDGFVVLEFTLKSNEDQKIKPDWFYLRQGKDQKVIHSLFLSSVDLSEKSPISSVITINTRDLVSEVPATMVLKYKLSKLSIDLSREVLWRK